MAWRLDTCVVRGEIDNRLRGVLAGRIWLLGRAEPVRLELKGDAHRDLAGTVLTFENPDPKPGEHVGLAELQVGVVGDITASRKVFVLDVSVEEAMRLGRMGMPIPKHHGNCLYIEWYSRANGRVVIESTDYKVSITPAAWTMTDEEEKRQIAANQQAVRTWMDDLVASFDAVPEDQAQDGLKDE